jgi:predicted anti-sigma-YlaC factor YlaD
MSEQRKETAFDEHLSECDECGADGEAVAQLDRLLRSAMPPPIDLTQLSQRVLAAAGPELRQRANVIDWHRLAAAVVGSLIPLPLVLALNALFVTLLHTVLTLVGLPLVASYVVVTYLSALVFVLGATYAAIPVLAERSAGARLIPLA